MSVISNGFKFGNITIDKNYTMTRAEMETLGDAEGYPDVFPIWCTDDNSLYIFYKDTNGVANIANSNKIINSGIQMLLYPIIDSETNELSWELREVNGDIPESVILEGNRGKSTYEIWLEQGNDGTEQDFLNSQIPDMNNLSETQISNLKTALGINEIEDMITSLNDQLNQILG